jgi:hypothetical protein
MPTLLGKNVLSCDMGILVSSARFMEHILGLSRAAAETKRKVVIFLTGPGVLLIKDPRFPELIETGARVTVCEVSFRAHGLTKPVPGLKEKDFTNQMQNAEMVESCARYLVF